jgi:hypothetical protein
MTPKTIREFQEQIDSIKEEDLLDPDEIKRLTNALEDLEEVLNDKWGCLRLQLRELENKSGDF